MSSIASGIAWKCKTKTHAEKLVLLSLADHHNKSNEKCFPSVKVLMDDAQISRATVFRCLFSLEEQGFIKREPTFSDGGRQTNSEYTLIFVGSHGETPPSHGYETGRVSPRDGGGSHHETGEGLTGETPLKTTGRINRKNQQDSAQRAAPDVAELKKTEKGKAADTKKPAPLQANRNPDAHGASFEEFWSAYPQKKGKARAKQLWGKLKASDRAAAIASIPAYRSTESVRRGFIQQGDTFLSKRTWEDFDTSDSAGGGATSETMLTAATLSIHRNTIIDAAKRWWKCLSDIPADIAERARQRIEAENWAPYQEGAFA
jgi:hypothetical protein